jgi:long-chain acyl-CoA synthetase
MDLQLTYYLGLTEASPTCFNAFTTDSIHTRLTTVGKVLPHARAKIIDAQGNIVPVGQRGELCMAGYQLTKGYWKNPEKTAETFITDSEGVKWLKTGDEASFNEQGYCTITGRFKDIIIRGNSTLLHGSTQLLIMASDRRREHLPPRNRRAIDRAPSN